MEEIVSLKNVSVTYDGNPALRDATVSFPKNKITAIIGPSGCGKTTLLHTINSMTAEIPGATVTGKILLSGEDVRKISLEALRKRVGLVFQTPLPFPVSVYQNMIYVPRYYGNRDKNALNRIVREKLEQVGLYDELAGELRKNATALSGGQQQRLCIARALTAEPSVLLLDEPCSALDVKSTEVIEQLLLTLKERYTIIIVTHNLAQARRIADQVVFLYNGAVTECNETETIFTNPVREETQNFLSGVFG